MLGRCVTQIDHALAQHDSAGRAAGQIGALCRNLIGETERIRRARTCNLYLGFGLPRQCFRDIVRRRRKRTKLRMSLREVVRASRQAPKVPTFDQSGASLVNCIASGDVRKITRRETPPRPRARPRFMI